MYFREGEEENAANRAENNDTMLTGWFRLNQNDPTSQHLIYPDLPYHYVWNKSRKNWQIRKRGQETIISRMYNASVREGERYFLRVLLLHVPGATSFENLRTFEGTTLFDFSGSLLS